MSTATSARVTTASAAQAPQRVAAAPARGTVEPSRHLRMGTEEAAILNLDLSGLPIPKVGGLNVDGFKPSLFDRLFGRS
ncbi:MAG TPA: hypothetical protein VK629_10320 [Steroidobacteraceae bacterium]|nr:hypothetical protein [Steroidobacteraceae bacterium]